VTVPFIKLETKYFSLCNKIIELHCMTYLLYLVIERSVMINILKIYVSTHTHTHTHTYIHIRIQRIHEFT
jgi:hypothetical protein